MHAISAALGFGFQQKFAKPDPVVHDCHIKWTDVMLAPSIDVGPSRNQKPSHRGIAGLGHFMQQGVTKPLCEIRIDSCFKSLADFNCIMLLDRAFEECIIHGPILTT